MRVNFTLSLHEQMMDVCQGPETPHSLSVPHPLGNGPITVRCGFCIHSPVRELTPKIGYVSNLRLLSISNAGRSDRHRVSTQSLRHALISIFSPISSSHPHSLKYLKWPRSVKATQKDQHKSKKNRNPKTIQSPTNHNSTTNER